MKMSYGILIENGEVHRQIKITRGKNSKMFRLDVDTKDESKAAHIYLFDIDVEFRSTRDISSEKKIIFGADIDCNGIFAGGESDQTVSYLHNQIAIEKLYPQLGRISDKMILSFSQQSLQRFVEYRNTCYVFRYNLIKEFIQKTEDSINWNSETFSRPC